MATRAIKFTGAREWYIRDSRVVWSNLEGSISTRLLCSPKASSSGKSKTTRPNVQKLVPSGYQVKYVQAVSKDEILVTAETWEINGNFYSTQSQKLILISVSGKTKWIANVKNQSTRPAIGRSSLYLINVRTMPVLTDTGDSKISFIKLSLSTGSIEMDKALPISDNRYGLQPRIILRDESLVLNLEETCAMLVDQSTSHETPKSAAGHHIICTTTGSLLYSYTNKRRPLALTATSSITQNAVWAYGFPHTQLTEQNARDKSWATHYIRLPSSEDPCYSREMRTTLQLGFDGDRSLFSHLIHDDQKRSSKIGVSTAIRGTDALIVDETTEPTDMSYTPSIPSLVTLPDGDGRRRELEVKLPLLNLRPYWGYCRDFFGFVDGYIAYHHKEQRLLLLIDFRPDW